MIRGKEIPVQLGISVTKKVSFRGIQQEFSNVYHYSLPTAVTAPYEALLDEIVAWEKTVHSVDVTFVRGSVWTSGGTIAQNQMQFQKDLTGAGAVTATATLDRERAYLVRWPAGFSSTGKPVFLRKWYHCCGAFPGTTLAAGVLQNTQAFATTERTAVANAAESLRQIGAVDQWDLVAESGRTTTGPAEAHSWLEHHQLGDQWRG